jgi:hypothetical protein
MMSYFPSSYSTSRLKSGEGPVPTRLMPPMPSMRYVRTEQETIGQAGGIAETKGEVRKEVKGMTREEVIREEEEGMEVTDRGLLDISTCR